MKISRWIHRELPTIFFLLTLVGFELVAALLMPAPSPEAYLGQEDYADLSAVTQVYSIPFRALSLFVMICVLVFYKEKGRPVQMVTLLIIYYVFWLIRLFFDVYIRTDIPVGVGPRQLIFAVIGFLSILAIKRAYWYIDFNRVFKLVVILESVCVLGMLIRNPLFVLASSEIHGRTEGSIGLNPISTANMAMTTIMLVCYWFIDAKHKLNLPLKIVLILLVLVSLLIGLRASSRGPLVSFGIVFIYYLFCLTKNPRRGVAVAIICLFIFLLFKDQLLELLGYISPVLQERFLDKGESGLQREEMARNAINGFLDHPLFGYAYGVLFQGKIGYPHNTVLEAFNGLGIFGGLLYLLLIYFGVKASYDLLHAKEENSWLCLLFMMGLVESMFSGCFYDGSSLCMLWALVFIYHREWSRKRYLVKMELSQLVNGNE